MILAVIWAKSFKTPSILNNTLYFSLLAGIEVSASSYPSYLHDHLKAPF